MEVVITVGLRPESYRKQFMGPVPLLSLQCIYSAKLGKESMKFLFF